MTQTLETLSIYKTKNKDKQTHIRSFSPSFKGLSTIGMVKPTSIQPIKSNNPKDYGTITFLKYGLVYG